MQKGIKAIENMGRMVPAVVGLMIASALVNELTSGYHEIGLIRWPYLMKHKNEIIEQLICEKYTKG